jgi:shikimate dehydrogenase
VNAAFAAAGLDWAYAAFEVAPGDGALAVAAMRTLGLGGLSVTMPHKHDVVGALDQLSAAARVLGAVNCIAWDGVDLVGHNTDGDGLIRSLHLDEGIDVSGMRCAVLGAGGAARSVVRALGEARAAEVVVVNRTAVRAEQVAPLAGAAGRVGSEVDVRSADLVVNATSVGMGAEAGAPGPLPVAADTIGAHQIVVDLVYLPVRTPLLETAAQRGARPVDGIGMLVHQAAIAVELWTGIAPDVAVMAAAARR